MWLVVLEQNVEWWYLWEFFWLIYEVVLEKVLFSIFNGVFEGIIIEILYEIIFCICVWCQIFEWCWSVVQVCLCLGQLERFIVWEKFVNKVMCLVCWKGDNDEFFLFCDGCDCGCYIYCYCFKMEVVLEGDWFCIVCLVQQVEGEFIQKFGFLK